MRLESVKSKVGPTQRLRHHAQTGLPPVHLAAHHKAWRTAQAESPCFLARIEHRLFVLGTVSFFDAAVIDVVGAASGAS